MSEQARKNTFGLSPRNQYMILGVLGAVLVGVLAYQMAGAEPKPVETAAGAAETGQLEPVAVTPVPAEPKTVSCDPTLPRDPFIMAQLLKELVEQQAKPKPHPAQAAKSGPDPAIIAEAQSLALKGILGDDTERIAYINGSTVKAGDTIEGFQVREVRESGVVLRKEKTDVLLQLPQR
ncbi:MAG TPA: general secretion pathway protein GspB [Planctomycetota bacterium]|nr:general secretion pathway protein GspB [Planctomycetota bacterium]